MSVAETQPVRTFIAVEVPDEIKSAMSGVQAELGKSGAHVGWVRPEGIHLTLKFLGDVEAGRIEGLGRAVEDAVSGLAPFTLDVKGVGVFPNAKAPRVVWLGLGGEVAALAQLYDRVEAACGSLGFPREDRPFRAHLTLGRVKSPQGKDALTRAVAGFEKTGFGTIRADAVSIMKSELRPSGAVYTEMKRAALSG